jgi:acyl-CoA thioesterase YciA
MELITTKICMALDIGVNGNLFGGVMMSVLDESAAAYTCQICDSLRMVTKKIEEVVFESPVKVGNIIKVYGEVDRIGRTSITIKIEARKHNVYTAVQKLVCSTKVVFVKIDDEGTPVPIAENIKTRYSERKTKYGRGLLTTDEIEAEAKEKLSK